jgi:bifunctional DNA-binding transcriptional regulator/antitoxin component of YhaV-PrlF toxin-antitoxin module
VHYQRNVPVPKEINERAKISYDGKSLFIRLPAKIRDQFKIKQGQYMKFYAEIKNGKKGELKITIENA